ncbi:MAG: P-loop NTPase [Candidatus Hydrogenedentota bacterium]
MRLVEEVVSASQEVRTPDLLVVGGGKGGVGKTCFSVNLAIQVARKGWQVVLVDADLSCSNLEAVLGAKAERPLDDYFLTRERPSLASIVSGTPYDNLRFVPGATGLLDAANPRAQQRTAFMQELQSLQADLVIVDLDAGAHLNTLDFFLMTESDGVLVITPEKTSIDNAYKFLRAALFRKIERFYDSPEVGVLLKRNESLPQFLDRVRDSALFSQPVKTQIVKEIQAIARGLQPKVVVNRARKAYEAQVASNILCRMARQNLMIDPERLGFLFFDKRVSEAVNAGIPFVVSHPRVKVSACVGDICSRLGYL